MFVYPKLRKQPIFYSITMRQCQGNQLTLWKISVTGSPLGSVWENSRLGSSPGIEPTDGVYGSEPPDPHTQKSRKHKTLSGALVGQGTPVGRKGANSDYGPEPKEPGC
ncbi:unnamed protein product, partial [Cuscuta europaea]